ncbi:Nucleoside-diphosphate-sugar epimerase [Parapedobacter luteus]|uniref:Nucleoside-diphosphate-sugar epimerase n=1 Tax=Parapedobacter luteus TaxID=623280 RepID=A0A1T5EMZ7_9SPHI|nr:NAD-dependent epimerase/dehydratase family protein [Parapedobacter luteus]SKB85324.1 Nucleoside-diphosphate-sugar epimerase [Parapedobacter luteus]
MQTILGSGGAIGNLLAKELTAFTSKVRLVARNPTRVNENDELFPADLLDASRVSEAVAGSDVVYLTVGLPYDSRVWQRQWPTVMQHVIDACLAHQSRLVFFDNVYMYDKDSIPHMTEKSRIDPPSRKGKVRAQLVRMIDKAMADQSLRALIARSADFYGPDASNGLLNLLVLEDMAKGKKPKWQGDVHKIHSFTYTPDAAKATAILGNTAGAYGQVWHLPTSAERWTGQQFIETAAALYGTKPACMLLRPWMLRFGGLFSRTIAELVEMQYQYNQHYFFDSERFCREFGFTPTTYEAGMKAVLASRYSDFHQRA